MEEAVVGMGIVAATAVDTKPSHEVLDGSRSGIHDKAKNLAQNICGIVWSSIGLFPVVTYSMGLS